ncbi:hypothetical protein J2S09_000740 [Bacillus fengqiuensis]|nr:hypothetical protein [Bacillus fengqiuensis]
MRMKLTYLLAFIMTIVLGLASRSGSDHVPLFVARHAGDALWAGMVYFGFRFLFTHQSLSLAVLLSMLFSFGIEFSQLYRSPWINDIRNTLLGALVLGKSFVWLDLLRYTVGILLSYLYDRYILQKIWQHPFS